MGAINHQVSCDFNKMRDASHGRNRPRHRGQREAVCQNDLARFRPRCTQGRCQRIPARGHRKAIPRPHQRREFLFKKCDLAVFARHQIIAMKAPGAHDIDRGGDCILGDRRLLGETAVEILAHCALMTRFWRVFSAFQPRRQGAKDSVQIVIAVKQCIGPQAIHTRPFGAE